MLLSKIVRLLKRQTTQTVMGQRIPEPRPTVWAAVWAMLVLGLPVLVVGMAIDGLIQLVTGHCTGVWCYF